MSDNLDKLREISDKLDRELPADAMLRLLVDMMLDGLAIVKNGCFVFVNQAFAESFGYNDDELLGVNVQILVPPEQREIHAEHMRIFAKRPRSLRMDFRRPITGLRKDGKRFQLEVGLSPTSTDAVMIAIRVPEDIGRRHAEHPAE